MEIDRDEIIELLTQVPLFANLGESDLNRLAGLCQRSNFREGDIIFEVDGPAEAMYIIFEGQVKITLDAEHEDSALATLKRGDVFGEEAMLFDDPRYYKAVVIGETILLRLSVDYYDYIAEDLPGMEEMLEVSIHSRQLSIRVPLPWLGQDEYVHVMTRRHSAILWSKLVGPIVFGFFVLILFFLLQILWQPESDYGWISLGIGLPVTFLWLLWTIIDWRNDYLIVTNKRVAWIEKVALIYESRQEAPLRTIMSIGMQRSRLGTMLGYADVVVLTYVGTIRLRDLAHAEIIANLIESYWHRSGSINRREESQVMEQLLRDKLDLPWEDEEETRSATTRQTSQETPVVSREPGFFRWLLSDFIRLRYEQDESITYRKHWFVLIEKIWLPVSLLLLTMGLLAARLGGMLGFIPLTTAMVIIFLFMFAVFVWTVYQYADWRNDIFRVTLDQIIDIDRKPLGKIRRRSAPLENVLSIEYERLGFWGFLFNFGTVYISVGNTKLTFDHVYNPSEVQQDIFYRMGERLEKVRQFEIESERDRISEWLATYHRKTTALNEKSDKQQ